MRKNSVKDMSEYIISRGSSLLRRVLQKISDHSDSIRYYFILITVLGIVGTAAYHYRNEDQKNEENVPVVQTNEYTNEAAEEKSVFSSILPQEKDEIALSPVVGGNVVAGFCDDYLIWSSDLQQWRTHRGVDFSAEDGEAVHAAFDGEVIEVYRDNCYGNTIVVDHGEKGMIRYSSLSTLEMVQVGERVKRGEVIGGAGKCLSEASLGTHVHLEYLLDGQCKDFVELMADNAGKTDGTLQD